MCISDTLGNTQIRRPLWERTAFSRSNWPYPSDIPADGSANGSSPREKFLGTSENTRWKLRWVEEVGPQPESRAIANAKWLRDNFCLSSTWNRGSWWFHHCVYLLCTSDLLHAGKYLSLSRGPSDCFTITNHPTPSLFPIMLRCLGNQIDPLEGNH